MKPDIRFHCVDLRTLVENIENRRRVGAPHKRRMGEVWSACIFALCLENNERKRFLIGFPERGSKTERVTLEQLLSGAVGELDDWDVVLVPDLGPDGPAEREFHQCQLVSYRRRANPGTQDLIQFLEEKKLRKAAGGDLRLVIHLEQETGFEFDWVAIAIHLTMRRPKCPYQQVFMLGDFGSPGNPSWRCRQLFPRMLPMLELDLQTARQLLQDRPTFPTTKPMGNSPTRA